MRKALSCGEEAANVGDVIDTDAPVCAGRSNVSVGDTTEACADAVDLSAVRTAADRARGAPTGVIRPAAINRSKPFETVGAMSLIVAPC
jgi:hypothetical protein